MQQLRSLLTVNGRFPCRRTWERRLKALPDSLPAQLGCLGRLLVALIQPWATCGRAAALDNTVLRAHGGVARQASRRRYGAAYVDRYRSAVDEIGLARLVYGWKLHLVSTVAAV